MRAYERIQQRRVQHTAPETTATLDHMVDFFHGGSMWAKEVYQRPDGATCLVGAANHVKVTCLDDAKYWLMKAITEVDPSITSIEHFNDTCGSFDEINRVINRAKQMAIAAAAPQQQLERVLTGEILPPQRSVARARPSLFTWSD